MRRAATLLALVLTALPAATISTRALATDAQDSVEAKKRFEEGLALFEKRDYNGARAAFQQAYALAPTAEILLNLAIAELHAGRPLEALAHFKKYKDEPKARRDVIEKKFPEWLDRANKQTGHIRIEAESGTAIYVDARLVGTAPLADVVDVSVGQHRVEAKGAPPLATDVKSADLSTAAGETVVAHLLVAPATKPAPAAAPASAAPSASTTGAPTAPNAERSEGGSTARVVTALAVGGTGMVLAGVGVGFFISAGNHADEWKRLYEQTPVCPQPPTGACAQLQSEADARVSNRNSGRLLVGLGSALVVGGLITYVLWPTSSKSQSALTPMVSPGVAGAMWSGRF